MKLGDKIVTADGRNSGHIFKVVGLVPNRDAVILECEQTGEKKTLDSFHVMQMMKVGNIRIWRNGLERAQDIAERKNGLEDGLD